MSLVDDYDYDIHPEERERRCQYCGERFLHWEEQDYGRWVLVDEDGVNHICPGRVARPGAFKPVD